MNNSRLINYNWPIAAFPPGPDVGARSAGNSVDYEKLFVSELPTIERVIAQVCRRNHLREAEAEDFASEVKLRLIEDDYRVLRRFRRRSAIGTYLSVVVHRQFLDYRNRTWGRWRPSAEASRLGETAVLLERLTERDGCSFDEAQQHMRSNYGVTESRAELQVLWSRLPRKPSGRRFVSEEVATNVPSSGSGPDANIALAERDFIDQFVSETLERVLGELSAEDRLLLKMRYDEGFTVSQIARALHMPRRPLYRRFERLCEHMKQRLQRDGVSVEVIRKLFDDCAVDHVRFNIHRAPENGRG